MYYGIKIRVFANHNVKEKIDSLFETQEKIYFYFCQKWFFQNEDFSRKEAIRQFYYDKNKLDIPKISDRYLKPMVVHCCCHAKEKTIDKEGKKKLRRQERMNTIALGMNLSLESSKKGKAKIFLPEIGSLILKGYRRIQGKVISFALKKEIDGKYYLCLICQQNHSDLQIRRQEKKAIGIYLDKNGIYTSDGNLYSIPKRIHSNHERLAILKRRLSFKKKSTSNNFRKIQNRILLLQYRIRKQLTDFFHPITKKLIVDHTFVAFSYEKGKQNKLSSTIFLEQLSYKAKRYPSIVHVLDQTSLLDRRCHECSYINSVESGKDWTCSFCGSHHGYFANITQNILCLSKQEYRRKKKNFCS